MDCSNSEILIPIFVDPRNAEHSTVELFKFERSKKLCFSSVLEWTLLPNEIWAKIFSHLVPEDILNLRLVCRAWSNLVAAVWAHRFSIRIRDIDQVIELLDREAQSQFCRRVHFTIIGRWDIRVAKGWIALKRFCIEFGPQITELTTIYEYEVICFLLSPQIRKHLHNIKKLSMCCFLFEGLIPTSFSFLSKLEYIDIGDMYGTRAAVRGYVEGFALSKTLLTFVVRLLESGHQLKGMQYLSWLNHSSSLIPAIFNNGGNKLETLRTGELELALLKLMASSPLKEIRFRLLNPFCDHQTFYNFLSAHSQTLERMDVHFVKCCDYNPWWRPTLTTFPRMDVLVFLRLDLVYSEHSLISSLFFTAQLPNLEEMRVRYIWGHKNTVPHLDKTFQHEGLRKLITSFDYCCNNVPAYITLFLNQVPFCFPHLAKLELTRFYGLPRTIGRLTSRKLGLKEYSHDTWEAD